MYVVNWETPDGQPGWHEADDVQEAVAHVEHLRNRDGVEDAHIFRLEEVAFEYRPYFRVELAVPAPPPVSFAASIAPDPDPAEPVEPEVVATPAADDTPPSWSDVVASEPELAVVDANGGHRRGLFGR